MVFKDGVNLEEAPRCAGSWRERFIRSPKMEGDGNVLKSVDKGGQGSMERLEEDVVGSVDLKEDGDHHSQCGSLRSIDERGVRFKAEGKACGGTDSKDSHAKTRERGIDQMRDEFGDGVREGRGHETELQHSQVNAAASGVTLRAESRAAQSLKSVPPDRGECQQWSVAVVGKGGTVEREAALFPIQSSDSCGDGESLHTSSLPPSASSSSPSSPPSSYSRSQSLPSRQQREFYDLFLLYSNKDEDSHAHLFRQYCANKEWKVTSLPELPVGRLTLTSFRKVMECCSYVALLISPHFLLDKVCERHYNTAISYGDENEHFYECVLPIVFEDAKLPPELGAICHVNWGNKYADKVLSSTVEVKKRLDREASEHSSYSMQRTISVDTSNTTSMTLQMASSLSGLPEVPVPAYQFQTTAVSRQPLRQPEQEACLMPSAAQSPSMPPIPVDTGPAPSINPAPPTAQHLPMPLPPSPGPAVQVAARTTDAGVSALCEVYTKTLSLHVGAQPTTLPAQDLTGMSGSEIYRHLTPAVNPGVAAQGMFSPTRFSQVCELLDGPDPRDHNWKFLAETLDLTSAQIDHMGLSTTGQTRKLLEIFFMKNARLGKVEALGKLAEIFKTMDRYDAFELVDREVRIAKCK